MKETIMEITTGNIKVKETFREVQNAVKQAELMNKKFICLTSSKTKESIMININHIICF